jgi:palmitoyltransferase ZDHHC2/15/20
VWSEVLSDGQYEETLMPINYVLLAVISGIIGIVLTGFTGWHMSLARVNMTTIECLEKTRYLSPLRRSMQHQLQEQRANGNPPQTYGQQLREIHANAIPGVTRPEEGEERPSPIQASHPQAYDNVHQSYEDMERTRERERYEAYLDERISDKLPNAFDLGWRNNLTHLMGPNPLFWALPISNTTGDGWSYETSPKWFKAREKARGEMETSIRMQEERERHAEQTREEQGYYGEHNEYEGYDDRERHPYNGGRPSPKADRILGRNQPPSSGGQAGSWQGRRTESDMSLHTIDHTGMADLGEEDGQFDDRYDSDERGDRYQVSSDEEDADKKAWRQREGGGWGRPKTTGSGLTVAEETTPLSDRTNRGDDWRAWEE